MISIDSPLSTPPSVPYGRTETYAHKVSREDRNEYRGSDGTLLYVEELYMDSTSVANGYPVDAKGRRHGQFIHFEENGDPKEKCDYVHDLQHGMSEEYINGTLTRTTSYMNGERNGPLVLMAGGSSQTYYYLDDQEIEDGNPKQIWEREKARVEAQWQEKLDELTAETSDTDTPAAAPAKQVPAAAPAAPEAPDDVAPVRVALQAPPAVKKNWSTAKGPGEDTIMIFDADGKKRRVRFLYPDGSVRKEIFFEKKEKPHGNAIELDRKGRVTCITPWIAGRKSGVQYTFNGDGTGSCRFFSGDKETNAAQWKRLGETVPPPPLRPEYLVEDISHLPARTTKAHPEEQPTPAGNFADHLPPPPRTTRAPKPPKAPRMARTAGPKSGRIKRKEELDRNDPENRPYFENISYSKVLLGRDDKRKFVDENDMVLWTQQKYENGNWSEIRRLNKYGQTVDDLLTFHPNGQKASVTPYVWGMPHGEQVSYDETGREISRIHYKMGKTGTGETAPKNERAVKKVVKKVEKPAPQVSKSDRGDPVIDPYFKDKTFAKSKTNKQGRTTFYNDDNIRLWSQENHPEGAFKEVRCYDKYGQAVSEVLEFDKDGDPTRETPYKNGKPHGKATLYDAEGRVSYILYHKGQDVTDAKPDASRPVKAPAAPVVRQIREPAPIPEKNTPDDSRFMQRYNPETRTRIFADKKKRIRHYEVDHPNGMRMMEYSLNTQGNPHGQYNIYYANGQLRDRFHFKNGVLEGKLERFSRDGKLMMEAEYSDNLPNGPMRRYENGQLAEELFLHNGLTATGQDPSASAFPETLKTDLLVA